MAPIGGRGQSTPTQTIWKGVLGDLLKFCLKVLKLNISQTHEKNIWQRWTKYTKKFKEANESAQVSFKMYTTHIY